MALRRFVQEGRSAGHDLALPEHLDATWHQISTWHQLRKHGTNM